MRFFAIVRRGGAAHFLRLELGATLSGIGFAWGAVRLNEARPGTLRVGANTFGSLPCHGFSHSNAQIRQTYGGGRGIFPKGGFGNFNASAGEVKGTEKPCAGPGMKGGFLYELHPGPGTVCKKGDGPNPVLEILPCAQTKLRSLCETCLFRLFGGVPVCAIPRLIGRAQGYA